MLRLAEGLARSGLVMEPRDPLKIPLAAGEDGRKQLRAEVLLKAAAAREHGPFLAVVTADIYAEAHDFVFGLANVGGHGAVLSIARLQDGDSTRFSERVLKEALHELGHTWGLPHCHHAGCVMQHSDSIEEADAKDPAFCDRCQARITPVVPRRRR